LVRLIHDRLLIFAVGDDLGMYSTYPFSLSSSSFVFLTVNETAASGRCRCRGTRGAGSVTVP
jgi:hypothetical protein